MFPFSEFMLFLRSFILSDLSEGSIMELKHKALDLYSGKVPEYALLIGEHWHPIAPEDFRFVNDILWQEESHPTLSYKILLIKYIRDKLKVSLKEAKDAIDNWPRATKCPPEEIARRQRLGYPHPD